MSEKEVRVYLIRLLARREYGSSELRTKLLEKGFAQETIDVVLANFQKRNLQSDERWAKGVVRAYVRKGYGARHIAQLLRSKGASQEIITYALTLLPPPEEILSQYLDGRTLPVDKKKLISRLQRRGFDFHTIQECLHDF